MVPRNLLQQSLLLSREYFPLWICLLCVKSLLAWGYRSTDFEVHRNWLAVTYHIPPPFWYTNVTFVAPGSPPPPLFSSSSPSDGTYNTTTPITTSPIWTLDYPPAFAYFEWILAQCASWIAPDAILPSPYPVVSTSIILFQRLSVLLLSDAVLYLGLCTYIVSSRSSSSSSSSINASSLLTIISSSSSYNRLSFSWKVVLCFILCDPGLFFLDHIHFQYNGGLLGLLFFALACFRCGVGGGSNNGIDAETGSSNKWKNMYLLLGALLFTVLVLSKHLFLPLAPLIGVYLWKCYCCQCRHCDVYTTTAIPCIHIIQRGIYVLGVIFITVTVIVFPIFWIGSSTTSSTSPFSPTISSIFQAMMARLFPFGRGLVHGYWAPNAWALYMFGDRVAAGVCRKVLSVLGGGVSSGNKASSSQFFGTVITTMCSSSSSPLSSEGTPSIPTTSTSIFPSPSPFVCAMCVVLAMLPTLISAWIYPLTPVNGNGREQQHHDLKEKKNEGSRDDTNKAYVFLPIAKQAAAVWFAMFAFGWHVHEKAAVYGLSLLWVACAEEETREEEEEEEEMEEEGNEEEEGETNALQQTNPDNNNHNNKKKKQQSSASPSIHMSVRKRGGRAGSASASTRVYADNDTHNDDEDDENTTAASTNSLLLTGEANTGGIKKQLVVTTNPPTVSLWIRTWYFAMACHASILPLITTPIIDSDNTNNDDNNSSNSSSTSTSSSQRGGGTDWEGLEIPFALVFYFTFAYVSQRLICVILLSNHAAENSRNEDAKEKEGSSLGRFLPFSAQQLTRKEKKKRGGLSLFFFVHQLFLLQICLCGLIVVILFSAAGLHQILVPTLPFLHLLCVSITCAITMVVSNVFQ